MFTVTNNAINVPIGTYLVTFGASGSTTGEDTESATLYLNGAATTENFTFIRCRKQYGRCIKNYVMKFITAGTHALYNTTGSSVTFDMGYITVTQLSTTA